MVESFLEFYGKHEISPVRQDLSDYKKHTERRRELYRHLGLLPTSFKDKKILEVGPGGGYNSLVIADWEPSLYVLIEANKTGINDIKRNFAGHPILEKKGLQLIEKRLEETSLDEKFDIVLCEQTIPHNKNQKDLLNKLDEFTKEGGIMVLTCIDEISSYFEIMKRYFGFQLVKGKEDFREKVNILVDALGPHKRTLSGSSRFEEDWVIDNFLNEAVHNSLFSMGDCINFFREKYQIYNTSPKIFTDYRWFKKIPEEDGKHNEVCLEQFNCLMHNFFYTEKIFDKRKSSQNLELLDLCKEARKWAYLNEFENKEIKKEMGRNIGKIIENAGYLDKDILNSLKDIYRLNKKEKLTIEDLGKNCKHFMKAFGKCSQYISLTKNNSI
ncbi:MAG: methyltransferase domain-containing protein [Candidatus Nanoarchaeia archaeon]|nr:methyltransferase domain-containing protein [Candidatus Nanoarchaeia archaeon]MDD5358122.1 methyltransferase domain-containing protein [Candidatus Nanoarchaeia archaeon]MDD5589309.1 methyltransferase domain-containing protein [Candidatus Nanoarchaeia archaeon]